MRTLLCALSFAVLIAGCGKSTSPTSPSPPAGPRVLYVSPSGSDRNDGSVGSPFQTISSAVSRLRAGDTLYLRGGLYAGPENVIDSQRFTVPSGSSWSNAVTIAGHAGEWATIQPPNNVHAVRLTAGAPSYLILQDFTIDMANDRVDGAHAEGIYVGNGAHHNRFLRLEVKNAKEFGVHISNTVANSPFNEVIECDIHSTGDGTGNPLNGHAVYAFTSDNVFEGNNIHDNEGSGIDLYNNTGPKDVRGNTVRRNRVYRNGRSDHGGSEFGIIIAWGAGNRVHDNTVYDNEGGILIYSESSNAEVFNNVVYGNTPNEGILVQYALNTIVRDNAVYGNAFDIVDLGVGTVMTNNRNSQ